MVAAGPKPALAAVACRPQTLAPVRSAESSDLILDIFGQEIGQHARSAVGLAELPLNIPVELEAEVAIRP